VWLRDCAGDNLGRRVGYVCCADRFDIISWVGGVEGR